MIFENDNCEVCGKRPIETGQRCNYCRLRYDSQKKPFIIYCEILTFEFKRKPYIRGHTLNVLVMDGRVVYTSPNHPLFLNVEVHQFLDMMLDQKYILKRRIEATYKNPI